MHFCGKDIVSDKTNPNTTALLTQSRQIQLKAIKLVLVTCRKKKKRKPRKRPIINKNLIKNDGSLDGALVPHSLKTLAPLLQPVRLVDDTLNLHLAAIKVANGGWEHVGLGERAKNSDLVTEDLARWPADTGVVTVHTVNNQLTSTADIVDSILQNLRRTGGLQPSQSTKTLIKKKGSVTSTTMSKP
jgi:hypothetical protein